MQGRVLIAGFIALLLLVLAAGSAAADMTSDRPLAVLGDSVFWRGANDDLWIKTNSNGTWGAATDTGVGGLASAPSLASAKDGTPCMYWRGSDGELQQSCLSGGAFPKPTEIGVGPMQSAPDADTWADNTGTYTGVFYVGSDDDIWVSVFNYSSNLWSTPKDLGLGPAASTPSGFLEGSGSSSLLQIFWEGPSGNLEQATGSVTSGTPGSLTTTDYAPGPLASAPEIGWLPSGHEDVYWQGSDDNLYRITGASSGQTQSSVGFAPVDSGPTEVSIWPTEEDLYWVGDGSNLWEAKNQNGTWSGPTEIGSMLPPPPATTTTPVAQTVPAPAAPPSGNAGSSKAKAMRVPIVLHWTWHGSSSRLRLIRFRGVPASATITVSCRGRGCPRRLRLEAHRYDLRRLDRELTRITMHAGQRWTVQISAPGYRPERARFAIRSGQAPLARVL